MKPKFKIGDKVIYRNTYEEDVGIITAIRYVFGENKKFYEYKTDYGHYYLKCTDYQKCTKEEIKKYFIN